MNRKGQALVEFVLILPVLILILFAIIDFGTISSEKNNLENESIDIVMMIKNDTTIDKIKEVYADVNVESSVKDKYMNVKISKKINIMTPGLNLIIGDPYNIVIERNIIL